MGNKYKTLLKNSFWTLIGNSGSKLLSFLLLPLYTKWLGTNGFGQSDLITTYSTFLISIITLSISEAIFVFTKNADDENKKSYYSTSLIFTCFIIIIWGIIFYIIKNIMNHNGISNSFSENIWFIYGIVISTFLQKYIQQFVISLKKIKIYSFTGIILTFCTFIFSFLLIPSLGVKGYIIALILANIVTMIYSFTVSKSYRYLNLKSFDYSKIYPVLKYSIPLIPNSIIWWLVSALNRPIMEYYLDYSSIGIYAVANRFPHVINMIFSIFSVSWNISAFEEYNKKGYKDFYINVFNTLFLTITIVAILFISFSEIIIDIFTTPDFKKAYLYMPFLILAAFFSCISSFLGTNFSVIKKSKYYFYSSIWGAISAIILNLILIPRWGLWGATLSTICSFGIMTIARYKYSLSIINVNLIKSIILYISCILVSSIFTILFDSILTKLGMVLLIIITLLLIQNKYLKLVKRLLFNKNNKNHE